MVKESRTKLLLRHGCSWGQPNERSGLVRSPTDLIRLAHLHPRRADKAHAEKAHVGGEC